MIMLSLRMMTMLMLGLSMMRMKTAMAEVFSEIPQLRVEKLEILQKGGTYIAPIRNQGPVCLGSLH